jgi:hypothetical protein
MFEIHELTFETTSKSRISLWREEIINPASLCQLQLENYQRYAVSIRSEERKGFMPLQADKAAFGRC